MGKRNLNLDQLIAQAEREIAKQQAYLKELHQLKAATKILQTNAGFKQHKTGKAFTTGQSKWKDKGGTKKSYGGAGSAGPRQSNDFEARLAQETQKIEQKLRAQFEAEYSKKFQKAIKKLRSAGKKKGIKYIRLQEGFKKQPTIKATSKGYYVSYKNVGHSPSVKPLKEKFTERQKAEARAYHEEQSKKAGYKYKSITDDPKKRGHVIWKQKQEIKETANIKGIDLDGVIYQKGSHTSTMMIKHLAKFRSFLQNPNTKEKKREHVWQKVLRGEVALGSVELDNYLKETRDLVGDHYGIDTP